MSIKIHNLFKSFSSNGTARQVLRGLNLQGRPGEVIAIHGANGAGKTTLLKIMAGLIVPDAGEVILPTKRYIGFVPDAERSFYQILSIRTNIHFYGLLFGIKRSTCDRRMCELAELLGISTYIDTVAGHCSSGIRQRAALIRALIADPSVLLIDELTRSLDQESAEKVSLYLRQLADNSQKTMIVVTHDPEWSKRYADTIMYFDNGILKSERST